LLEKLNERIERLGASTPRMLEPMIEVQADDEPQDGAGADAPAADP